MDIVFFSKPPYLPLAIFSYTEVVVASRRWGSMQCLYRVVDNIIDALLLWRNRIRIAVYSRLKHNGWRGGGWWWTTADSSTKMMMYCQLLLISVAAASMLKPLIAHPFYSVVFRQLPYCFCFCFCCYCCCYILLLVLLICRSHDCYLVLLVVAILLFLIVVSRCF